MREYPVSEYPCRSVYLLNAEACDEPTSALDGATGQKIMGLIRELTAAAERVVIVVTHDERIYHFADRIAHLDDGRVTHISTPAEALAETDARMGDAGRSH